MGSEHKCDICNWTYDPNTYLNKHNKFYIVYIICGRLGDEYLLFLLGGGYLRVSDSKNGARLEWWVKSLYNDLYHWMRIHY